MGALVRAAGLRGFSALVDDLGGDGDALLARYRIPPEAVKSDDGVRKDGAYRHLTQTDLPLSQITAMVGLSEQSALMRSARRWFGDTPSGVRRRRVHQDGSTGAQ